MNIFVTTGRLIGDPQTGQTQAGKAKAIFVIEADAQPGDLPHGLAFPLERTTSLAVLEER